MYLANKNSMFDWSFATVKQICDLDHLPVATGKYDNVEITMYIWTWILQTPFHDAILWHYLSVDADIFQLIPSPTT